MIASDIKECVCRAPDTPYDGLSSCLVFSLALCIHASNDMNFYICSICFHIERSHVLGFSMLWSDYLHAIVFQFLTALCYLAFLALIMLIVTNVSWLPFLWQRVHIQISQQLHMSFLMASESKSFLHKKLNIMHWIMFSSFQMPASSLCYLCFIA